MQPALRLARIVLLAASLFALGCPPAPRAASSAAGGTSGSTAHQAAVDAVVKPLIEDEWFAGVAVGMVTPEGTEFYGYGRTGDAGTPPPAADTVFEMGSVTKVFTSLALARLVLAGEAALDGRLADLLPAGQRVPERDGKAITLEQLATHTSGLPRMPDDFAPADPANPYADLSWDGLLAFLARCELPRAPGERYEYSNLGAGLLGDALARRAGRSFEAFLTELVLRPLGLRDTTITLSDEQRGRFAVGHDADGNAVPAWDFSALAGAGALRTTVADMVTFVRMELRLAETPLAEAMLLTQQRRHDEADGSGGVALGWHVGTSGRLWHNGGTGGFHGFVAFDPAARVGVVVLANTGTFVVDDLGATLLGLLVGEPHELELPPTAQLATEALERCVGVYEIDAGTTATVTRDGHRLLAQITGQPALRIFPETETLFHYRVVAADVEFHGGESGRFERLTIRQDGTETAARRIAAPAVPPPAATP